LAALIYSERALADLERLADFLPDTDPLAASETIGLVGEAVRVLRRHPMMGRQIEQGLRELVIPAGGPGIWLRTASRRKSKRF